MHIHHHLILTSDLSFSIDCLPNWVKSFYKSFIFPPLLHRFPFPSTFITFPVFCPFFLYSLIFLSFLFPFPFTLSFTFPLQFIFLFYVLFALSFFSPSFLLSLLGLFSFIYFSFLVYLYILFLSLECIFTITWFQNLESFFLVCLARVHFCHGN